jgi:rhodanese-related sulfurtransferase
MEAAAKLAAGQALLVDVVQTTPGTGLESARPVAYRLPPEELDQRWQELPRAREIIAYCTDPHEATSACVAQYLRERGYRAHALAGGFAAWRDEGFPRLQRLLEGPA